MDPFNHYNFESYWGGAQAHNRSHVTGRVRIEKVPVDRQGYTRGGQYVGVGGPVFSVSNDYGPPEGEPFAFQIRAKDLADAKRIVRIGYPNAKGLGGGKRATYTKRRLY